MKKNNIITILLCCVTYGYAQAQLTKGDWFLNVYADLAIQPGDKPIANSTSITQNNYLTIRPSVGFLLNEHWALGGQIGYMYSKFKNESADGTFQQFQNSGGSVGIFAKRFFNISEKCLFSLNASVDYSRGVAKYDYSFILIGLNGPDTFFDNSSNPTDAIRINIRPSFLFFPSPKWGFQASVGNLGYSYERRDLNNSGDNTQVFGFDWNFVSIGVNYFFKRQSSESK